MKAFYCGLAVLMLGLPVNASAAGDAAAGQAKSITCSACHGPDGNSAVPMWPKLAGQHETYLVRQLQLIQSGKRDIPEMAALVSGLTEQDIADIAAYYSAQSITPGVADSGKLQLGQSLYRAGNPETGTPACSSCHGPNGRGNPVSGYAVLAGQHAAYIDKSLKKFRATNAYGEDDAPSAVMSGVVRLLSDEEIAALSSYIQGLHVVD